MSDEDKEPNPEAREKPKSSKLGCALLLFCLAAIAGAGAFVYFFWLRPSPRAHRHIPRGVQMALRADAVELFTFKPVREHLWPVLIEARKNSAASDIEKKRARIREATGVTMPDDLREIIVASVDAKQWIAAIAGPIKPGRFVDGMEKLFREDGVTGWTKDGDLLVQSLGAAIGQAEDGTIVIGTGKSVVLSALPERDDPDPAELPLPTSGALSFMMTSAAYRGALGLMPSFAPTETLAAIERLNGTMTLSETPKIDIRLLPKGITAAKLAAELEAELGKLKLALLLLPSDLGGGKQAIGGAKVSAQGDHVQIATEWPYPPLAAGIERAADVLAELLARRSEPR
jgi:hypothetical protein